MWYQCDADPCNAAGDKRMNCFGHYGDLKRFETNASKIVGRSTYLFVSKSKTVRRRLKFAHYVVKQSCVLVTSTTPGTPQPLRDELAYADKHLVTTPMKSRIPSGMPSPRTTPTTRRRKRRSLRTPMTLFHRGMLRDRGLGMALPGSESNAIRSFARVGFDFIHGSLFVARMQWGS